MLADNKTDAFFVNNHKLEKTGPFWIVDCVYLEQLFLKRILQFALIQCNANKSMMEASQQARRMAEGNVIIKRTTLPA